MTRAASALPAIGAIALCLAILVGCAPSPEPAMTWSPGLGGSDGELIDGPDATDEIDALLHDGVSRPPTRDGTAPWPSEIPLPGGALPEPGALPCDTPEYEGATVLCMVVYPAASAREQVSMYLAYRSAVIDARFHPDGYNDSYQFWASYAIPRWRIAIGGGADHLSVILISR
ncbi:MAG TPA: hypothetical protein VNQ52_02800 [Microbacteriaceae bacterium]|nr:hypothetical protein [Microbacteriaceae bacterium]